MLTIADYTMNYSRKWHQMDHICFSFLLSMACAWSMKETYNSSNCVTCYRKSWWCIFHGFPLVLERKRKKKRQRSNKNIELNHIMKMVSKAKEVLLNWFKSERGNEKTIIHLCHHKKLMLRLVHTLSLKGSNVSFFYIFTFISFIKVRDSWQH